MTKATVVKQEPKRHKRHINRVMVPRLDDAIHYCMGGFGGDLQTILDSGITNACLSRTLGVSPMTVWRWRRNFHWPRERLLFVSVMLWAEDIRGKQVREQREVG